MKEKTLSWVEIKLLLKEIREKVSKTRINKISVRINGKQTILNFKIHKVNLAEKNLCFVIPHCFFLSEKSPEMPQKPYQITMILRKYLNGGFIRDIAQVGSERIVEIKIDTKENQYSLFIEFIPPGNIVLVDDNKKIVLAYSNQKWKDRTVKKGEKYIVPFKGDLSNIKEEEFLALIKRDDKKIVSTIAKQLRLGGELSEELLARVRIDKEKKAGKLSMEEIKMLFKEFKSMLDASPRGYIYEENKIFPFEMISYKKAIEKKDSFNRALAENCLRRFKKVSKYEKEIEKIKYIIKSQEEKIREMEEKRKEMIEKGNAIYANYHKISEVLNQLKKHSINEIKEKIKKKNLDEIIQAETKKKIKLNIERIRK